MLSIGFYSRFDEEQLPSFTQRLTPWQTWLTQGMWATDSRMLCSSPIGPVWCTQSIVWQWMVVQLWPGGILKLCFVFFSEKHAAFKWKDTISGFPVSPGSAEALVRWGGKIKYILIAYFRGNICAKNCHNRTMCVKMIASERWDVFETQCTQVSTKCTASFLRR